MMYPRNRPSDRLLSENGQSGYLGVLYRRKKNRRKLVSQLVFGPVGWQIATVGQKAFFGLRHGRFCPIEAGVVIVYVERLSSKRWISSVDFLKNFGRLFGAETWSILSNRSGRGLLESSSAPFGLYRNLNLIP